MNRNKELKKQFENPIIEVDIKTGEGYCRLQEVWDKEGRETVEE